MQYLKFCRRITESTSCGSFYMYQYQVTHNGPKRKKRMLKYLCYLNEPVCARSSWSCQAHIS